MTTAFSTTLIVDVFGIPNYRKKLYGSRRILQAAARPTTDYDVYLHISDLDALGTSLFELKRLGALSTSTRYSSSKPLYGETHLLLKVKNCFNSEPTTDILLFTDKRDIAIMDKVLHMLEHSCASTLLQDKFLRISVYNYMLQLEGFTCTSSENIDAMDINTPAIHKLIVASFYDPSRT